MTKGTRSVITQQHYIQLPSHPFSSIIQTQITQHQGLTIFPILVTTTIVDLIKKSSYMVPIATYKKCCALPFGDCKRGLVTSKMLRKSLSHDLRNLRNQICVVPIVTKGSNDGMI